MVDPSAGCTNGPRDRSVPSLASCTTRYGTVTLSSSRQLGESVSEHCYAVLQGPPLPGRDHQPPRVLYFRFTLSFREVDELMLERGVAVSDETMRRWCAKFRQAYASRPRRRPTAR